MNTKLIRLTGIIAAAVLALGIGATVQAAATGQSAQQQILAEDKGPASPKP
ncbi:hypothetical protein [Streptomyces sp. NBC_01264]|uniref:hypothetical protein n=1 Tax=Streptomyces sp. NBC_01264 TaxID=2903804 RepID=UPI00225A2AAC|nr:hypothetical protein [Streptomyces sp. NBC_01264]MCX4778559.1 hypothetical protein [Streptomyces sp. NBC_01264]